MAGLQRPAAGTVRLKGRDLSDAPEADQMAWRRQIGFVFEFHGRLLHHLTVLENILLPLQYHHDEEATGRAEMLLERAGLSHLAHTLPSRLNHRLQQRVALLRALAFPTEVLFLDNPLNGLGPSGLKWWREFLQQWRAENPLTVVATSNRLEDWAGLATHRATLEGGRLETVPGAN
jgi:ABC-type sulfate/molybdate transport systems ATPase subunit